MTTQEMLFQYCLRMGDTHNVLSHRMGEWCTNGHILEEDIAMTNIALDHIGAARAWLIYGGEIENKGRTEDDLAYHRDERDYVNMLIAELPNGNFADTIARNFMFDAFAVLYYKELLNSSDSTLAGIAGKVIKEAEYHLKHSSNWMVRLGDGTAESHEKMQDAINEVWRFTGNMFEMDELDQNLADAGIVVDCAKFKDQWMSMVVSKVNEATCTLPENNYMLSGSKEGIHTEALGHMLAEMQSLARAYPDAKW
ncbi:MAG: 1,2-phenylacetyl-CoA epoxidase subunit PaaC [Salibacteraceae bacterium]